MSAAASLCHNRASLSALALLLSGTATMAWKGGPTYVSTFCGGVLFNPLLAFLDRKASNLL
jgi:asparagine N-glycosylation enzyme membrane subunit Stt3